MSSRLLRISAVAVVAVASLLLHQGVGAQAPGPNISSVVVVSAPDDSASYLAGENIELSVQFTSGVRVAGSPVLAVNIGGTARDALFESVRGSEVLFAYSVLDADFDADGVSIGADALTLGRGDAITDSQGRNAGLAHAELSDNPAHRVNMSTVTIVAAGTEPVPEDESALYTVQRTGSLSRALTVHLDYVLDDNLSDPRPHALAGFLAAYVPDSFVPRTVTFQPGRSTAPLAVPLHNDAEVETADGSLTMIVSDSADYLVGQPDSATRILQNDNDVFIDFDYGGTGGNTTEWNGAHGRGESVLSMHAYSGAK